MARSKRRKFPLRTVLLLTLLGAAALLVGGEAFQMARSDSGQVRAARTFGLVDEPRLTRVIGRHVRRALDESGVSPDSVRETVVEDGPTAVRWRVGMPSDASQLQLNHAITQALERVGASVLSGRESVGPHGTSVVTLLAGIPKRPTHEIVLVRQPRGEEPADRPHARLALVLYGFGDALGAADSFFALPAPFAVAITPGGKSSGAMIRAAHGRQREVVLHLPMEPINYPQVNPGPGTLLVTMRPAKLGADVGKWLDQSKPVAAVSNHMGSLATQDMTLMTAVYRELKQRRLPFLHLLPAAGAVCRPLASEMGVLYDEPDATLDFEPRAHDSAVMDKRWKQVLKETRERGRMIVWVRATPTTWRWMQKALDAKRLDHVDLVPLSSLLRKPGPA